MKSLKLTSLLTALVMLGGVSVVHADSSVPKSYPLRKCVVSDEALGEHGKSIKVSHGGTDVYLCCKDCVKDFNKDPEKFTKMVKDAKAKK